MFSHEKSFSTRKSAFHHEVATNDRYSFFNGEAELTVFVGHRHGSEVTNVTKSYNYDFFCHNLEFVTSDPYICPTQTVNSASPLKKTVPIISGNFAMKSRFACAEAFSVRKHTNENPQV